jgi:hypothetical protein
MSARRVSISSPSAEAGGARVRAEAEARRGGGRIRVGAAEDGSLREQEGGTAQLWRLEGESRGQQC